MSGQEFTKSDLQFMHNSMSRLLPPGGRPFNAAESVQADAVLAKLAARITATLAMPERGELVFSWRVPRELALTGNAYAGSRGWKKHKDRKLLDAALQQLLPAFPKAPLHGSTRRRWVRATRFSTQQVDECAIDLIGGKLALDSLQRADIVHDDDAKFIHREPLFAKTKKGGTHLLIEVFELAEREVETPEPADSTVTQIVRTPGFMTQAIINGGSR